MRHIGSSLLLCVLLASSASAQTFSRIGDESGLQAIRDAHETDWWLSGLTLLDLDGDDDLDLFLSAHGGGSDAAINDGSGNFTRASGEWPETEVHLAYDLDEDGLVDASFTYTDGGGRWWLNRSSAAVSFEETEITRDGNQARQQALADIDRDGRVDWLRGAYAIRFDLGRAGPEFDEDTGMRSIPDLLDGASPMPVDLDGDRDLDLVVNMGRYDGEAGISRVYREEGAMDYRDVTSEIGLTADGLAILGAGDFDHDGDVDLIGLEDRSFPLSVFLNDAGNFTKLEGAIDGPDGGASYGSWGAASLTDLDNDGTADLLVSGRNYLHVLRGLGGGRFHYANDDWGIVDTAEASVDSGYAFGDVDGDGDLDLVGYRDISPRQIELYRNELPSRSYVRVRPIGLAGNRGAAGAIVELRDPSSGELLWREQILIYCKQAQQNYYALAETERHYGIGDRSAVDVRVEFFPSGTVVVHDDLAAASTLRIGEDGTGGVVEEPMPRADGGTTSPRDGGAIAPRTDAGTTATDPPPSVDGCACAASGSPASGVLALGLVALVLARRRR